MLGDALGSVVVMISAGVTIVARHILNRCDGPNTQQLGNITALNKSSFIDTEKSSVIDIDNDCPHNDPEWVLCIDPILR